MPVDKERVAALTLRGCSGGMAAKAGAAGGVVWQEVEEVELLRNKAALGAVSSTTFVSPSPPPLNPVLIVSELRMFSGSLPRSARVSRLSLTRAYHFDDVSCASTGFFFFFFNAFLS